MAPNICLGAKNMVRKVSLMDICDIPIQVFAAISSLTGTLPKNQPSHVVSMLSKNIILIWKYFNADEIKGQFN